MAHFEGVGTSGIWRVIIWVAGVVKVEQRVAVVLNEVDQQGKRIALFRGNGSRYLPPRSIYLSRVCVLAMI